jgi:hypothetical protein
MVETQQNEAGEQPEGHKPPEGDEGIMTLDLLCTTREDELAAHLRAARTLSPEQVARNTAQHDLNDLRPEERAAFDTGSMHRLDVR